MEIFFTLLDPNDQMAFALLSNYRSVVIQASKDVEIV